MAFTELKNPVHRVDELNEQRMRRKGKAMKL
jgi:hypothetical protein